MSTNLVGASWYSQLSANSWFQIMSWSQGCEIEGPHIPAPSIGLCVQCKVYLRLSLPLPLLLPSAHFLSFSQINKHIFKKKYIHTSIFFFLCTHTIYLLFFTCSQRVIWTCLPWLFLFIFSPAIKIKLLQANSIISRWEFYLIIGFIVRKPILTFLLKLYPQYQILSHCFISQFLHTSNRKWNDIYQDPSKDS